jgi:hypothetical protein
MHGEHRNAYKFLAENPLGKKSPERPSRRWKDNFKRRTKCWINMVRKCELD